MKKILFLFLIFAMATSPLAAQQNSQSNITGMQVLGAAVAAEFGKWSVKVPLGAAAAGASTVTLDAASFTVPSGMGISPIATNIPIRIEDGASSETLTPSAVNCSSGSGICTVTATFANAHPNTLRITSGTNGLQEAIEFQHGRGGMIHVTSDWLGTTSMITNANGYTNVSIWDTRAGAEIFYTWDGSDYVITWGVQPNGGVTPTTFAQISIINNIRFCNQFAGANAAAKIAACIADLPSTGGTADARGIEGNQTWPSDPFSGVTKPVNLLTSSGTTTVSTSITAGSSIMLTMGQGSIFSLNSGVIFSIARQPAATLSQHFAGVGHVEFNNPAFEMFPEWWGCIADGVTDCLASFNQAVWAAGEGATIKMQSGVYKVSNTVTVNAGVTRGITARPNYINFMGIRREDTFLVHGGTQTTGAFRVETPFTWNGTFYGCSADSCGRTHLDNITFASNYGPAVNQRMAGFTWHAIGAVSACTTCANFLIEGGGGDSYDQLADASGTNWPINRFFSLVVNALPTGMLSLPLNGVKITSGTFNDGVNGDNGADDNRFSFYGFASVGSMSGNAFLVTADAASRAIKPSRVDCIGCQIAGAPVNQTCPGAGCLGPAPAKVDGATEVRFIGVRFEAGYNPSGTAPQGLLVDSIIGTSSVWADAVSGWGACCNVDIGDPNDTATNRPYKTSFHMTGSAWSGIRLNSNMLTNNDILDLVLRDNIVFSDTNTFSTGPASIANYSVFDTFFTSGGNTRSLVTGGDTTNKGEYTQIIGSITAPTYRIGTGGSSIFGPAAVGAFVRWGSGSPEGVVTGPVSSIFIRSDGAGSSTIYMKQSGASNTGWSAMAPINSPVFVGDVTATAGDLISSGSGGGGSMRMNGSLVWYPTNFAIVRVAPSCSGSGCAIVTGSTSFIGRFTTTTTGPMAVTLTFPVTFAHAVGCFARNETSGIIMATNTATTTAITITGTTTSGDTILYMCVGPD